VEWQDEVRAEGEAGHLLDNGWGRKMRCDPARAYTQAPALMGQGGARDIMGEALLRLPGEFRPYLRTIVHDEVVMSVPAKDAEEIGREVQKAMTWEWKGVPILCDLSKPGRSWGEVSAK
jgi:DNA polymerase-1